MLVELCDRAVIADWCRRDAAVQAYLLGDLDDFFWPHTQWFGWETGGELDHVALLYTEPVVPVLLAFGRDPSPGRVALVRAVVERLPERFYAHLAHDAFEALGDLVEVESGPELHLKLALTDEHQLRALALETPGNGLLQGAARPLRLGSADLEEVTQFYAAAYPGSWFEPRMLETGCYVGVRASERLVCVAGVHVYSPAYRVAALGNVATLPEGRGLGLATFACAVLCRDLLDDGIETISLNVQADNTAARTAYERLGFSAVAEYVEASVSRRAHP